MRDVSVDVDILSGKLSGYRFSDMNQQKLTKENDIFDLARGEGKKIQEINDVETSDLAREYLPILRRKKREKMEREEKLKEKMRKNNNNINNGGGGSDGSDGSDGNISNRRSGRRRSGRRKEEMQYGTTEAGVTPNRTLDDVELIDLVEESDYLRGE